MTARPVYDLALPGSSIYEALRYLQHAHAVSPVTQVVLALDLFMFNATRVTESGFSETRLAHTQAGSLQAGWARDLLTALFSSDALKSSLETIVRQGDPLHVPYLPNGAHHPTRNWRRIQSKGRHRKTFLSNERYSLISPDGWGLFQLTSDDGSTLPTMETLRQLIAFCYSQDIDLHLLITPIHARKLEVLWHYGLWSTYELWKQQLTEIVTSVAPPHSRSEPFALWDFSGYNSITTESAPPIGDSTTQMQWFWEGSHYHKETSTHKRKSKSHSSSCERLGLIGPAKGFGHCLIEVFDEVIDL
jgi:hypothetical protein